MTVDEKCPACNGKGGVEYEPGLLVAVCSLCDGSGLHPRARLLRRARFEAIRADAAIGELIDRLDELGTLLDVAASVKAVRNELLTACKPLAMEG